VKETNMTGRKLQLLGFAAALALTAGCAKKAPETLPPAPGTGVEDGAGEDGGTSGGVDGVAVPGSRADFIQSVGQMGDRILFDTDQYNVDDQDRATLDTQAAWLQRHPNVRVTIEGHADERGTREYNLALGERRANAAKNYLQSRGIDASRLTTISWGKERPEALGSDEGAWAQNRRAVTVVPQ
jgi:peptidoglycan-associated lipoprotein